MNVDWTIGRLRMASNGSHLMNRGELYRYPSLEEVSVPHTRVSTAIAVHPSKPWVALGELDGGIRVFDWSTLETKWRTDDLSYNLAWSPTGDSLAVAAGEGGLRVYDASGQLVKERDLGSVDDHLELSQVYCDDGKALGRGLNVFAKSVEGPIQWSPDGRAILFSSKPMKRKLDETSWYVVVLERDAIMKVPWGRTVFGEGDIQLLVNAPNGERASVGLSTATCESTDVGEVNPLSGTLADGRTFEVTEEGLSVAETVIEVPGHRPVVRASARGTVLALPADVPVLVNVDTGAWIQVHADDEGVAAVGSDGRFWVEDGAEELIAAWSGRDVLAARRWNTEEVRAGSDSGLWASLP